ncbi:ABC transporter ATP-binding protein [Geobacter sp. SVR]|uniref:ABC transporter ATP-binding protein n=1 Tax=Geobacter sp. SVR TaxID=2495594 RepID=UPI00143EF524|nr:ABC transporter ATP-binding protein [Geobacter sp. SVR]BCS52428.1 lipid A export permease/ATP-binding protein MsbA [Geobacter sp. SVR]GCF87341.1 lipid A export permease/ATP-binding protein MsbA [Geobacter sp. SVR]
MNPILRRTLGYFKPYWGLMLVSALCSMIVGGLDGAFAWLVEPVLKKIFAGKDTTIFLLVPIGIIILFIIRGFARYTYDTTLKLAGQKAVQDIRNDAYAGNVRQDLSFFHNRATGELMSRMTNDIGAMQEGIANVVCGLFRDLISALSLLGVIFYRDWQLAIITFVVIPATAYPAQLIGKKIKNASGRSLNVMGGLTAILQETFSGIKVIKAFGLENKTIERFHRVNLEYFNQMRRYIKYESLAMPVSEAIISFGVAGVIYFGGSQVMSGRMTASELFSFIAAMVMVFTPIKKLQGSYNVLQRSAGAAERVFALLDRQRSIVERPSALDLGRSSGMVEFRDVSFSYGEEPVLRNVSLKAANNQMIALVGPSGGGKTTLVSLLPRFYDVTDGAILIDGHDIRDLTLNSLVAQIALVDQETTLFNESIANNIRYGKPGANLDEVIEAAKAAFAHDFIMQLPEGYDTNIGDRGVRLSGGQRQRICIARALLKNAPILILDEATSALDTESEQMVQQALDNLMVNRTTFVIAHRLSTVLHADRIVVLEGGRIVESGTHENLLSNSGLYSRLHSLQFNDRDTVGMIEQ